MNVGISSGTMQHMKKKMGIKSVHKIDDWYWTLNPDAEDADGADFSCADFPESELSENYELDDELEDELDETDEVSGTFIDSPDFDVITSSSTKITEPTHSTKITMQSPFGELTLIDWRAAV